MRSDQSAAAEHVRRLIQAGRYPLAIAEFERLVKEQPAADDAAVDVVDALVGAGDAAESEGDYARAVAYFGIVARWRIARGDRSGAADLHRRIERLELAYLEAQLAYAAEDGGEPPDGGATRDPRTAGTATADLPLRAARARAHVARGDAVAAAPHLTADMAGDDPSLIFAIAEILLRGGEVVQGMALVRRVLDRDPALGDDVVRLGLEMAERQPDAGFQIVDVVVERWVGQALWSSASAAFEDFLAAQPGYVPAVVRLREIEDAATHGLDDARVLRFRPTPPTSRTA